MFTKKVFSVLALTFLTIPSICLAAAPSNISINGSASQGATVTVSGANFGNVRTGDYWDVFDDYSVDYNCGINQQSCTGNDFPSTGAKWTGDGGWTKWYFNEDKALMTSINGKPLLHSDKASAQYSTGRGFTETAEYYTGGSGGIPNSGIAFQNIPATDEIYAIYHFKYDPKWSYPYFNLVSEKHVEIFLSNGKKMVIIIDNAAQQVNAYFSPANSRFFPICGETGGNSLTVDTPTSDGEFPKPGLWHEMKFYFKLNTPGKVDGIAKMWLDGKQFLNDYSVDFRGSSTATFFGSSSGRLHFFGNIQTPGSGSFTAPGAGNEWDRSLDDVWLWTTNMPQLDNQFPLIGCAYLSNQNTWSGGPTDKLNGNSNFVRQSIGGTTDADMGFKSWTNNQLKFKANLTGLNTSKPLYLYVTNWDGETNATGIPLSSSGVTILPAPSLTNVQLK